MWTVPVYTQKTVSLCWEACARMLWHWRFKSLAGYTAKAGTFLSVGTGLTEAQMDVFYKSLGLRSWPKPKGANVRHALGWTPVIFTSVDKVSGHAMVLAGFNGTSYSVVNPCGLMSVDFDSGTDSCSATTALLPPADIEKPLGTLIWYW